MILESYDNMLRRWHLQSDGSIVMEGIQDVSSVLDEAAEARSLENRNGKVEEFKRYAIIPCSIAEQFMSKGLNIFNHEHLPAIQKEIELNYPYLKVTNKRCI